MRSDRQRLCGVVFLIGFLGISSRVCLPAVWFASDPGRQSGQAGRVEQESSFQAALLAFREDRIPAALEALTDAERAAPEDARVRNFRGLALTRLGRNNEAAGEYREAIRLDPHMEDAYRNLGYLEWTEHRLEEARKLLGQALEIGPDDSFAHYYLGRVELEARRYQQAMLELKRSEVDLPKDPEFVFAVVTGFLSTGDAESAHAMLDRLDLRSLSPPESVQAAAFLTGMKRTGKALELLRGIRGATAKSPPPWLCFDLALVHLFAGDDRAAIEQATLLIQPPRSTSGSGGKGVPAEVVTASAWSLLGIAHAHRRDKEAAVEALRRATSLAPRQEEHWLNLTRELMELSRYSEAVAATHDALTANPDSYALHLRLGAASLGAGRYADAEAVFRDLVTAGDPLATSYVGLAQVLLRTDRASEAVTELAAARERLGPKFLISYFQGLSLNRLNRRTEAAAAFEEAIRLNPQSAEAHLGLGKTDLALGHVTEAIAQLKEALHLNPNDVPTRRLLTQARFRLARTKNEAVSTEVPAESPADTQAGEFGDFFVPEWQFPPGPARQ